jgi:MoaA/NifB/PqqE/SkfB family radical SAM enzyme
MKLTKPILLHYYITTRCNARCSFCDIWKSPVLPDASLPDVSVNLTAAHEAGCRFVDFTGGEPLLNRDLPQFLQHAKKLGYITSVTTNCLLFPERAGELAGLVDLLHFSVSADDPDTHDDLRGTPSFGRVLESVDVALQNRLVPDLLFTYTDRNISAFEGIHRLALNKRLVVILDPLFDINGADPIAEITHRKALEYSKLRGIYLNRAHISLRGLGGNSSSTPLCRAVDSTIVILPDNTLALPCFHHRSDCIPINSGLAELLSGSLRMEAAEKQGRHRFCGHCHINCYFDPSFAYMRNRLFAQSISAKIRYAWWKYIVYRRPFPLTGNRKFHN